LGCFPRVQAFGSPRAEGAASGLRGRGKSAPEEREQVPQRIWGPSGRQVWGSVERIGSLAGEDGVSQAENGSSPSGLTRVAHAPRSSKFCQPRRRQHALWSSARAQPLSTCPQAANQSFGQRDSHQLALRRAKEGGAEPCLSVLGPVEGPAPPRGACPELGVWLKWYA
jgi:hypothetical protein